MSTQLHPLVLEARFTQLATAIASGVAASNAALGSTAAHARLALRGFDALVQHNNQTAPTASLGRSAARLSRCLAMARGGRVDVVAIEQAVLHFGIEMGRRLEPIDIAVTVRGMLNGSAERSALNNDSDKPADALTSLFTQIAVVAVITRFHRP